MADQTLAERLAQERADELKHLYIDEFFTERQLAQHFKVSRHPIRDALAILGIPRRHGRGVAYRHPEVKPTKEQLDKWLNENLETLSSLAKKLQCDPSTIRNWAIEYDIDWDKTPWRRAADRETPIDPTCTRLEELYLDQELSLRQIADLFGCSRGTITRRLQKHGIPIRKSGWKPVWFKCKDGHRVRSTYEQRVDNWLFDHGLLHTYEPSLPFDPYLTADFLIGETYIEVWGVHDNEAYKERKERKRKLYSDNDMLLIQIGYTDFSAKAKNRWSRKLEVLLLRNESA